MTRGSVLSGFSSSSLWLAVLSSLSLLWVVVRMGDLEFSVSISESPLLVVLLLLLFSVGLFPVSSESTS